MEVDLLLPKLAEVHANYKSAKISQDVSPNDQMWEGGADWYFPVGESAMDCIFAALGAAWLGDVARVLDLPCGHGRVTRHLRAAFPSAELFACDIDRDGVDFCAEHFGATRIYSAPQLESVALPDNMDLIWIGSLFTHVDANRTFRWMNQLARHLSPHGVMVATFHGLWTQIEQTRNPMIGASAWAAILEQYGREGFGYAPYDDFALKDYGISLTRPSWLMGMACSIPDTRVVHYAERGWANNHDVLAISRNDRHALHPGE